MQKLLLSTIMIIAAIGVFAADKAKPAGGRHRQAAPSGGIVEKPYSGNVFRTINAQAAIPADKVAEITLKMRYETIFPFEMGSAAEIDFASAEKAANELLSQGKVGAGVVIVNDPANDDFIRANPEKRWSILNVAKLLVDKPSTELLEMRFKKLYWHSVVRALGGGYATVRPSVMTPFTDLKSLDAISTDKPSPDVVNLLIDTGSLYGIKVITIASYRTACKSGWAPAPTNEVQRVIWEQIHASPTEPMKIKFDPARGE